MGDYYGIVCKRALGEVSPCYRKIFSVYKVILNYVQ